MGVLEDDPVEPARHRSWAADPRAPSWTGHDDDRAHVNIGRCFDPRQVERLHAIGRTTDVAARRPLALFGSDPRRCWLLLDGHVKEHRQLLDGSEVVTDVRGPGDLVGETLALVDGRLGVDLTTLSPTRVLVLETARLRGLLHDSPSLAAAVQRAIARRAARSQRLLVRNGIADSTERVVSALLDLADRFGADVAAGRWIGVPLSQCELASWTGMSRESFAKILRRMRGAGLVLTSRRDIVLTDVDALNSLVRAAPPAR